MWLVADVQLCLAESQAEHRASRILLTVVGNTSQVNQQIVARLNVALQRSVPDASIVQSIAFGERRVRATRGRSFDTEISECGIVSVACEVAAHLLAELCVNLTGLGQ